MTAARLSAAIDEVVDEEEDEDNEEETECEIGSILACTSTWFASAGGEHLQSGALPAAPVEPITVARALPLAELTAAVPLNAGV